MAHVLAAGYITRAQFMEAVAKRGHSFSMRTNSQKRFDFADADAKMTPRSDNEDEKKGAK